jgi:hypothetical protein
LISSRRTGSSTTSSNYTEVFNVRPKKFECVVKVRSEGHRNVLERGFEDALEVLSRFPLLKESEAMI